MTFPCDTTKQPTVLQVRLWFQNEDPSSKLNSVPPIGAPKAAEIIAIASKTAINVEHVEMSINSPATPAAAPHETKSLFSLEKPNSVVRKIHVPFHEPSPVTAEIGIRDWVFLESW